MSDKVLERFLRYVVVDTYSGGDKRTAMEKQRRFAEQLAAEMRQIGLQNVTCDKNAYVYGTLPSNTTKKVKTVGLIAHMDIANDLQGLPVRPRVVKNYDGGDIPLNEEGVILRAEYFPNIKKYAGDDIVVTDGRTLLGADDKAGIAEILTAVEELMQSGREHGTIKIAFTPNDEIGEGADLFDVKGFGADYAYTVDGGELGEIEYENFNAAAAEVTVHGVNVHPGSAKGKMKNAALIAMEFNNMLPAEEIPAKTEGYEGFYHLCSIQGNEESCSLSYIIRDHDKGKFQRRKQTCEKIAAALNARYGSGTVVLRMTDSYYNMKEKILPHMYVVDYAVEAMKSCGVAPKIVPIRGGTDGAKLSYEGLPCPNLSTGGDNFHGKYEYIPVGSMKKMVQVLCGLMTYEINQI